MKRSPLLRLACVCMLSLILVLTGMAKLSSGYSLQYWLSRDLYYMIAIFELAAAVAIWTSFSRFVAVLLVVVLLAVSVGYWWSRVHWSCGCFGDWPVSRRQHLMLTAIMGLCALRLTGLPRAGTQSPVAPVAPTADG